ncbi:MAG: sulfatase-like hydrolase/transferase [Pirellulales bacterium]
MASRLRVHEWPRKCIHFALVVGLLAAIANIVAAQSDEIISDDTGKPPRPNIVFILADDLSPTAVGFAGNRQVQTPHIDRIAHEGAILTRAFVTTPVCSPSRAGLVASRYSSELRILDWINPREEPELGLDVNLTTWMQVLQRAGYRTGLFGKWHLGTADRFHPTRRGYDEFVGFRDGGRPPQNAVLEIDGKDMQTEGFIVDVVTDHALKFLERHADKPFLLSLHYREPHSAWLPTREEDWLPFRDLDVELPEPDFPKLNVRKVKRMTREYYASIASVDRNVGRVLEALDRLGIADNTIVVFTSDHGYHTGHHGLWFKGNAHWETTELPPQRWPKIAAEKRPNLYDQALRVPAAVRWPAGIRAGMIVPQVISNLDWYPTLLAMAGVGLPRDVTIRGHNAWPMFRGLRIAWDNDLYAEYSMRHGSTTDMRGYRTPEWKLMLDFANEDRAELYDLTNDPDEEHNLIDSNDPAARRARKVLEVKIRQRMKELNDRVLPMVAPNPSNP